MSTVKDEKDAIDAELARLQLEEAEMRKTMLLKRDLLRKRAQQMSQLRDELAMRENEADRLLSIVEEKGQELGVVEDRLRVGSSAGQGNNGVYSAYRGDAVDEQLARYINMMQCQVPIKRLGNGYYLFGTRKIFAKIMNGKLVIRVGGGFMIIEEFIATYGDQEINRCRLLEAQQQLGQAQDNAINQGSADGGMKKSMMKKTGGSPRQNGSPRPGSSGHNRMSIK